MHAIRFRKAQIVESSVERVRTIGDMRLIGAGEGQRRRGGFGRRRTRGGGERLDPAGDEGQAVGPPLNDPPPPGIPAAGAASASHAFVRFSSSKSNLLRI